MLYNHLPRCCKIFRLSSKILHNFQIVFQDVGQLSSKILHKTSMVRKSWSSSVLNRCTDKHLHEHDHNQHWTLVPPMCHKVTSGRAVSMQVRSSLRTTGRSSHKSTKLKQLNTNQISSSNQTQITQAQATKRNQQTSVMKKNPATFKIGHEIGLNGHILCFWCMA